MGEAGESLRVRDSAAQRGEISPLPDLIGTLTLTKIRRLWTVLPGPFRRIGGSC